ncbi:hypothetical protein [Argonema antarcticum]|uniref:hypothetical protein n=1 Tax=Argonema antarcticum TaxID=2942763 RepID=UPI002013481A|nr:hypothetical protein [Argonema antarcticum]MCL1471766.1 hypothetical protein [Argonema antarcticum A004/B2]
MDALNFLICQAFLNALAKLDSQLPPDIIPAINQVGQALAQQQTDAISDLEDIVKQHAPLAELYDIEYKKLLDDYENKERNKHLSQKKPDSPPSTLLENFIAPILMDVNPQNQAKNEQNKIERLSD